MKNINSEYRILIDCVQYKVGRFGFGYRWDGLEWLRSTKSGEQIKKAYFHRQSIDKAAAEKTAANNIKLKGILKRVGGDGSFSSGHPGIYFNKSRLNWDVFIGGGENKKYLSNYEDLDDAIAARETAEQERKNAHSMDSEYVYTKRG